MVSHHLETFGDYRHSGRGDMMYLVTEGQGFTFSRLNLPLLFISV